MRDVPSFFASVPVADSLDDELTIFLEICRVVFYEDRSTAFGAFEAVSFVAAREWKRDDEPAETDMVRVPWWALKALAIGYCEYKEQYADGLKPKLGQNFGMEVKGRGKRPSVATHTHFLRDLRLALWIADAVSTGESVAGATKKVADRHAMTIDRLNQIWAEHGTNARSVLSNFRTSRQTQE